MTKKEVYIYRRLPEKGAWTVFRFKRGLAKREGVFEGRGTMKLCGLWDYEHYEKR